MLLIAMHKVLQSFFLPPLNSMLFLIIGYFLIFSKKELAYLFLFTGIISLYVQSTNFFIHQLARTVETKPIKLSDIRNAQAIVVLGGGVRNNTYEYAMKLKPSKATLIRLQYASHIARSSPNKIIIVSGGLENNKKNAEADIMKNSLIYDFNITNKIITEAKSRNTDENAKFVAHILKKLNINKVIVITQAFHAKRAIALFNKYEIQAVAASTDYYNQYTSSVLDFLPSASVMHYCSQLLHEIFGYIFYVNGYNDIILP